jgi:hypothetical protein
MYGRMKYAEALDKAEHLKALGQTEIYIDADDAPWVVASGIQNGGSYRFNGPVSFWVTAQVQGLTFKWNVDMERRDANGRGVTHFDRDALREVARKLPPYARAELAEFLKNLVLPDVQKRTAEIREALNAQADSEDCIRGLIEFAKNPESQAA